MVIKEIGQISKNILAEDSYEIIDENNNSYIENDGDEYESEGRRNYNFDIENLVNKFIDIAEK